MPTEYVRKPGSVRGQWTVENLTEAIDKIEKGDLGVRGASRYYGIPPTTIQRRRRTNNFNKVALGPQGLLGRDNEKRLVGHILRLQEAGFAPDRTTIRRTAFEFAESLGLQHKFNTETRLAGYDWLASFLKRNKELSIGQAEGSSLGRPKSIENKEEVGNFFKLLTNIYDEQDLYTKPGNIFTVGETSCQLNNNPGEALATKGSNNVHCSTSDESVSVIACCNAEGVFLPPSLVIKGVRHVSGIEIGLPPGSKVYKNPKSSDVSSEIFYQWMVEHFTPQKPLGKVLLLLDGHSSHQSSLEMFDFAAAHDIILLCLPSHTTQAHQPLDRYIFSPFITSYKEETQGWVNYHKKQIKRAHAGALVGNAWARSATFDNAVNGFEATGIFPLNGTVRSELNAANTSSSSDATGTGGTVRSSNHVPQIAKLSVNTASFQPEARNESASKPLVQRIASIETPSCSKNLERIENTSRNASSSKYLHTDNTAPKLEQQGKRQRRQSARIRDEEFVHEKKHNLKRKWTKSEYRIEATRKSMKKEKIEGGCESEEDDLPVNLLELILLEEEDCCLECLLNYSKTDLNGDWLKCIDCGKWMHKTCTMYGDRCNVCGRREKLIRLNRIKK